MTASSPRNTGKGQSEQIHCGGCLVIRATFKFGEIVAAINDLFTDTNYTLHTLQMTLLQVPPHSQGWEWELVSGKAISIFHKWNPTNIKRGDADAKYGRES